MEIAVRLKRLMTRLYVLSGLTAAIIPRISAGGSAMSAARPASIIVFHRRRPTSALIVTSTPHVNEPVESERPRSP